VSPHICRALFWVGVFVVLVLAFALLQGVLMPFAAAFAIAYFLDPLVDRLQMWRISRGLASLIILLGFLLGVGLILFLLVPLVQGQIVRLVARFPGLVGAAQDQFGNLMQLLRSHLPEQEAAKVREVVGEKIGDAFAWFAGLFQTMITSSFAILSILSLVVVTPVVAFFLIRDWHEMLAWIDADLPRDSVDTIRLLAREIDQTLAGFVHGQALVCLILAVYYGTALSVAGLESALALGLLIGVLAIVPVAGAATGFALSVALAALQYGTWTKVAVVCGIFIFGQTVEANLLTPKLVGDRIHLHPVWVIFALLAGGKLFGFLGVLVSVPAAAMIGVLVRFALDRYRHSIIYDPREPNTLGRLELESDDTAHLRAAPPHSVRPL
jgi:predicted PurR-regulated permease PerM